MDTPEAGGTVGGDPTVQNTIDVSGNGDKGGGGGTGGGDGVTNVNTGIHLPNGGSLPTGECLECQPPPPGPCNDNENVDKNSPACNVDTQ
jgi:hypothetical protein